MTTIPIKFPIPMFESSGIRIDLAIDSRGYILFKLSKQHSKKVEEFIPIVSEDTFTCEYLPDLVIASTKAMKWINENCEEITNEGQHLYYRLRTTRERLLADERRVQLSRRWSLRRMFGTVLRGGFQ